MTAQLAPLAIQKFFDNNGNPLALGFLYSYAAGTTMPIATYVDSTQTTQNTNPVQLNFRGECALWLDPTKSYKFNLTDSVGNQIPGWPVDNIQGLLFIIYPQTPAEQAAGVTPANYSFPGSNLIGSGNVLRYENNTTPGTTDMSAGFAAAAASNITFSIPSGSYLTNSAIPSANSYSFIAQGVPQFSGTNAFLAWLPQPFTATFMVGSVLTNSSQQYGAFAGVTRNLLPANTASFPTGTTGIGRSDNGGNTVFGGYFAGYQYATNGGATGAEIDVFNMTAAPTFALPPNLGIGTSGNNPIALVVGAGGNFNDSIGIYIANEGSMPQKFLTGMYFGWTSCVNFGLVIDALLQTTSQPAVFKHSTSVAGVQVQGIGTIFGVQITGTGGQFSCSATQLLVGQQVTVAGTFGGTGSITGYSNPTTYKISATNGSTTFTLQTLGGGGLTTTAGTPTGVTFTAINPLGGAITYFDANGVEQFAVLQNGQLNFGSSNVTTSATAGANGAVPAQVAGYLEFSVNGTTQKIPYFNV